MSIAADGPRLSDSERAVVAELVGQWRQVLHITSIDQAATAVGVALDRESRLRIGDYLVAHPELSPILRRWGALTFTLSEDEKLLGRLLSAGPLARGGRSAEESGSTELLPAVETLLHFGLVDNGRAGYRLAAGWGQRLGPLGWTFHRVAVEGEPAFNVP